MKMQVCKNFTKFLEVEGYVSETEWAQIADYLKDYHYDTNCLDLSRVKNISIPSATFQNLTSLREVILPESLQTVGAGAFENCISLRRVTFPETVKTIENRAFYRCSLQSFYAPKALEHLGMEAFSENRSLTNITLNQKVAKVTNAFGSVNESSALEL